MTLKWFKSHSNRFASFRNYVPNIISSRTIHLYSLQNLPSLCLKSNMTVKKNCKFVITRIKSYKCRNVFVCSGPNHGLRKQTDRLPRKAHKFWRSGDKNKVHSKVCSLISWDLCWHFNTKSDKRCFLLRHLRLFFMNESEFKQINNKFEWGPITFVNTKRRSSSRDRLWYGWLIRSRRQTRSL